MTRTWIHPKRRLGQNFLQHQGIICEILNVCNFNPEDKVIEIGPGLGALTVHLLKFLSKLMAVEVDQDLKGCLQSLPGAANKLELLIQDALTVDFSQWGVDLRILGNLPYNIATPLLFHLLNFSASIKDIHVMLQKEVVGRMLATPGSKDYGKLSIMLQLLCEVTTVIEDIDPQAFWPIPKVQSAMIRLIPYHNSPYVICNRTTLHTVVTHAFAMRRKTLANNLKLIINPEKLRTININPSLRPEQITIHNYVNIANLIDKNRD